MDWYFDLAIVILMGVILLLVSVFTIGDLVQVKRKEEDPHGDKMRDRNR